MSNDPEQFDAAAEQARIRATIVHLAAMLEELDKQLGQRDKRTLFYEPEVRALRAMSKQIVQGGELSTSVEVANAVNTVISFLKLIEDSSLGTTSSHRIRQLSSARDVAAILARADDLAMEKPSAPEQPIAELRTIASYPPLPDAPTRDIPTEDTEVVDEVTEDDSRTALADPRQQELSAERTSRPGGISSKPAAGETALIAKLTLDSELVRSAATGNRQAVAGVLRALRPIVFRYCLGRLGMWQEGSSEAEDCAQEVLLAVVRALPGYRYEASNFLPFVFGIAAHKVSEFHRRRPPDHPAPAAKPPGWSDTDPNWSAGLLDTLPPRQREILILRIILGLSAEETAAAVGLSSAGAVRIAQHRALTTLRRHMLAQKRATS